MRATLCSLLCTRSRSTLSICFTSSSSRVRRNAAHLEGVIGGRDSVPVVRLDLDVFQPPEPCDRDPEEEGGCDVEDGIVCEMVFLLKEHAPRIELLASSRSDRHSSSRRIGSMIA